MSCSKTFSYGEIREDGFTFTNYYYKNGKKEGLWKDFNSLLFRNNKKLEINNLNDEEIVNFLRTIKDQQFVVQQEQLHVY